MSAHQSIAKTLGIVSGRVGYDLGANAIVENLRAAGFVIVPREPTPEMVSRGQFALEEIEETAAAAYRAMIDAALNEGDA